MQKTANQAQPLLTRMIVAIALAIAFVAAYFVLPELAKQDPHSELEFGKSLVPMQWLTVSFVHTEWYSLAGNVVFLLLLAYTVEGKLGWWKFPLIFLLLSVMNHALIQVCMSGADSGYLAGPGAILASMLGLAIIWEPKVPLFVIAFFFILFQLAVSWFPDYKLGADLILFVGLPMGLLLGLLAVKIGAVDCKGWDLLSVWRGTSSEVALDDLRQYRHQAFEVAMDDNAEDQESIRGLQPGERAMEKRRRKKEARDKGETEDAHTREKAQEIDEDEADPLANLGQQEQEEPHERKRRLDEALVQLRIMIEQGKLDSAWKLYQQTEKSTDHWQLPQQDLLAMIRMLHSNKRLKESVPLLGDFVSRFPDPAGKVRLTLAQILIQHENRPSRAVEILNGISSGTLAEKLEATRTKLIAKAEQMIEEGDLELDIDSW